jgi:hypothetical protein
VTKDIRISITFPHHPKTIKLRRKLGHKGVDCLITLWTFAGEYRPKGDFSNMTDEDIAIAAGWDEDPKIFIAALLETGYLKSRHATADNNARYFLNDWKEHNPWSFYSDERSEMARSAAGARWERRSKGIKKTAEKSPHKEHSACPTHTERIPDACGAQGKRYAPSPSPSPSPSPLPSPGGAGGGRSPSELQIRIEAMLGQFPDDERDLVERFLSAAAAENKSRRIADRTRHKLVNELFQLKCDFPDRFAAGLEGTVNRDAPNINYVRKVILGLGKQKQRTLQFRDAQKRKEEYDASRIAREKADRSAEKTREETRRRQRVREEAARTKGAGHGPGGQDAAGGSVRGVGQGRGAAGDRRGGETAAEKGGGAVEDGGGRPAVIEVSLADYLPGGPGAGGTEHAHGAGPGDGDAGRRPVVSAPGDRGGSDGRLLGER